MPRIVMKCHYIKGGSQRARAYLNNAVNYIATREGAEPILQEQQKLPATEKQCELIGQLLNDYPLCRGMPEFEDYLKEPTVSRASEFITQAIEENCDTVAKMQNYVQYIATRPRAQHIGKSALFSYSDAPLVLSHVANEVSEHDGNISLCSASCEDTMFVDCSLLDTTAEEASFRDAEFRNCDLTDAYFTHSDLTLAQFPECEMIRGSFQNCCLDHAGFDRIETERLKMDGAIYNEELWNHMDRSLETQQMS